VAPLEGALAFKSVGAVSIAHKGRKGWKCGAYCYKGGKECYAETPAKKSPAQKRMLDSILKISPSAATEPRR
jgi:hypothetical protein